MQRAEAIVTLINSFIMLQNLLQQPTFLRACTQRLYQARWRIHGCGSGLRQRIEQSLTEYYTRPIDSCQAIRYDYMGVKAANGRELSND